MGGDQVPQHPNGFGQCASRVVLDTLQRRWFVSGIATLLASLGAGWLWDRDGSSATFYASAAIAAAALAMLSLLPEQNSRAML